MPESDIVERLDMKIDPRFADEDLFIGLRYSSMSRWIYDNEIYGEALSYLPLYRLYNVKSLSLLTAVDSLVPALRIMCFSHSRYEHSLKVAMVMEEILKQGKVTKSEIKKGIVAGLIHDIATPALGNPVMDIDPVNLNEEDHWRDVIDNPRSDGFLQRHELEKNDLDAIIHNQGYLGKALDIADRIVYVGDDAHALFGQVKFHQRNREISEHLKDIFMIIREDPQICDIYQSVGVDSKQDKVFFQDPALLYKFLKLRALLTKKIYLHPLNQARDRLVSVLIAPFYTSENFSDDKLTPSVLRQMDDNDLISFLNKKYMSNNDLLGYFPITFIDTNLWPARYQEFSNIEKANDFIQVLNNQKNMLVLGDAKVVTGFNAATSYLVKEGEGNYTEYRLIDPNGADEIEEIERSSHGIYVLYVNLDESSLINELLKRKKEMFGK